MMNDRVSSRLGTRLLSLLLCLLVATATSTATAEAVRVGETLPIYLAPEALAEAERPSVEISSLYLVPGPERFYGYALRDLRDYLEKLTRARFPLTAAASDAGAGIYAGTFEQFPSFQPRAGDGQRAMASTDPEAFVIEAQDGRLYVLGRSAHGLMAAVYTLLDRLGVRWYAPGEDWEHVPELSELVLDESLNVSSEGPSYQWRTFFFETELERKDSAGNYIRDTTQNTHWSRRNRLGGSAFVNKIHNEEIIPPELFKTRPELFARITQGPWAAHAVNGRLPREIARHKPEVVELAVQNAIAYFEEHEGKGSFYDSFSLETGDGVPPDEEGLAKFGNATDLNFWFANQVAAGLEKAGYTDKWVGMYSYSDHSLVPSFDLHPQVGVEVAAGLSDPSLTVEERLAGFRERKTQRLGVYTYFGYTEWWQEKPGYPLPARPLHAAATVQSYYEHGARGYTGEDADTWINSGAGRYVVTRLLWDVSLDPQRELEAYYEGTFGPAAEEVRTLYESWEDRPSLSRGHLARWHDLISRAEQKIGDDRKFRARINDIKRYYLYLNLFREFEIDLTGERIPSKEDRFNRMLRYIASNRGEGAFAGMSLVMVLVGRAPSYGIDVSKLDPQFAAIMKYNWDEEAWGSFPHMSDAQIDEMFAAARLPLDGQATGASVLDPAVIVFPADARPPAEVRFPRLHGPPIPTGPRHYVLMVPQPVAKLGFEIAADVADGGEEARTMTMLDDAGNDVKKLAFKIGTPVEFELTDVRPGVYTLIFPEFGAERLTVRGGGAFGAVRAFTGPWGFSPYRPADLQPAEPFKAYFLVPPGKDSLRIELSRGTVELGFADGGVIAEPVEGDARLKQSPRQLRFPPSKEPRIAYVASTDSRVLAEGLVIQGVTLYSLDPSYVLYESVE